MRTTPRTTFAVVLAGLAIAGVTAGCSSSGGTSTSTGSSSMSSSSTPTPMSSSPMSDAAADVFGPACASVPADGAGSFDGMAADPVATAASNNPALSTLVSAVTAAGLGDTLNGAQDITVLAPADSAFAAMDQKTLNKALADPKGLLTTVLTYHVIAGRLSPDQLAGDHKTLEGGTVSIAGSGEDFTVNRSAKVVCGNVQTANATVYIIDGVLLPKM